ncbi:MAG: cytochrome c oxidase subunit 3 [Acidimicrobiales bacterium]
MTAGTGAAPLTTDRTALAEARAPDLGPTDRPSMGPLAGRSLAWWGMVMAITTEAMIFALLLFAWFYLWTKADRWPPPGDPLTDLGPFTIGRTVLLLGSSLPVQLAERRVKAGDRRGMLAWLALGWAMAAVFLGGHVDETIRMWSELRPSTDAYGSLVYLITNLHALHLIIGLLFLAFVFGRGLQGRYTGDGEGHLGHGDVTVTVLYWHFVDAVWVAVFSSLYLAPHFGGPGGG